MAADQAAARRALVVLQEPCAGTGERRSDVLQDYDGRLPSRSVVLDGWPLADLLSPYGERPLSWQCFSDTRRKKGEDVRGPGAYVSYGYNWRALTSAAGIWLDAASKPEATVAFVEADGPLVSPMPGDASAIVARHRDRMLTVVGFLDGLIKNYMPERLTAASAAENGKRLKPGIDSYPLWNMR